MNDMLANKQLKFSARLANDGARQREQTMKRQDVSQYPFAVLAMAKAKALGAGDSGSAFSEAFGRQEYLERVDGERSRFLAAVGPQEPNGAARIGYLSFSGGGRRRGDFEGQREWERDSFPPRPGKPNAVSDTGRNRAHTQEAAGVFAPTLTARHEEARGSLRGDDRGYWPSGESGSAKALEDEALRQIKELLSGQRERASRFSVFD